MKILGCKITRPYFQNVFERLILKIFFLFLQLFNVGNELYLSLYLSRLNCDWQLLLITNCFLAWLSHFKFMNDGWSVNQMRSYDDGINAYKIEDVNFNFNDKIIISKRQMIIMKALTLKAWRNFPLTWVHTFEPFEFNFTRAVHAYVSLVIYQTN